MNSFLRIGLSFCGPFGIEGFLRKPPRTPTYGSDIRRLHFVAKKAKIKTVWSLSARDRRWYASELSKNIYIVD